MKPKAITKRIAALRNASGLSNEQLAKKAGLSQVELSRYCNGRRNLTNLINIAAIATACKVPTDFLILGDRKNLSYKWKRRL